MEINTQIKADMNYPKPKKVEVLVGVLTDNDVKDHGTATGVAKTVNRQKNKIRPRQITKLEDPARRVTSGDKANEAMAAIRKQVAQRPSDLISAQANPVPERVLHLLR